MEEDHRLRAAVAGREIIKLVLILYYCWRDPETPPQVKVIIWGALGYFIAPLDAIPDLMAGVGYSDDLGALGAVVSMIAVHIKPEHRQQAEDRRHPVDSPGAVVATGFTCRQDDGRTGGFDLRAAGGHAPACRRPDDGRIDGGSELVRQRLLWSGGSTWSWCWGSTLCRSAPCWSSVARRHIKLLTSNALR